MADASLIEKELRAEAKKALAQMINASRCTPIEREFFILGFIAAMKSVNRLPGSQP